ncbi:MAG: PilZ domain-containing protein [Phycisphaerales bacterium]|nr:PilZ domain-containing protein [Phycisphaerales bacterium]
MLTSTDNRRVAERFQLSAPYTRVLVTADRPKQLGNPRFSADRTDISELEGHAYDISISGLRFELDEALAEGMPVEIELHLPGCQSSVKANAKIVRVFDHADDPGPRRMAAHFEGFENDHAEQVLRGHLGSGFCGHALKY